MLYAIAIQPIELLFTVVYAVVMHYTNCNIGLSISILSIIITLLTIPLYKNAFKMQSVKSYVAIPLQIFIFVAAYNFLSRLPSLRGTSFGAIGDLGNPDGFLSIGAVSINVLPILLCVCAVISVYIHSKQYPLKAQIFMYIMPIVFIALLYRAPSGLVLYWMISCLFVLCIRITKFLVRRDSVQHIEVEEKPGQKMKDESLFWIGSAFLTLFIGLFIPLNLLRPSVAEFADVNNLKNPLILVGYSALTSIGAFVLWMGSYYKLESNKIRSYFPELVSIISVLCVIEYMYFGNDLGLISSDLKYESDILFDAKAKIVNLLILFGVAALIHLFFKKIVDFMRIIICMGAIVVAMAGAFCIWSVNRDYAELKQYVTNMDENSTDSERLSLSRHGRNVVFIMLDRAMGTQFPYIINEKPELKDSFSGFTYYRNTVSFGQSTNFAAPAIYGGYEYTPWELNKRDDELIPDKHNEALKVLPVLFNTNGFDVTVCDPPYAGYKWIPNLSIYDDYPGIKTFNTEGKYNADYNDILGRRDYRMKRNFFCYSVMRVSPLLLWGMLYDDGMYNEPLSMSVQATTGISKSYGYNESFLSCYAVLEKLTDITNISDGEENTFLMFQNSSTHEPTILQEPDYIPELNVDNTDYDSDMVSRYTFNGKTMLMNDREQVAHYHVNMASLLEIADWLDMLKEEGVYDNTRIVIVSDHGRPLGQFGLVTDDGEDIEAYLPLMLMKDFGDKEYKESDQFMTNADCVSFMVEGIIDDPVNPFTGNTLDGHEKYEDIIRVTGSLDYDIAKNRGYTFLPASWYSVSDDPYSLDNWRSIGVY